MIASLILFAAKRAPIVATAAAIAWIGKKVYIGITGKHVRGLDSGEIKERFVPHELFTVLKYEGSKNRLDFEKMSFSKDVDENGVHYIAFFEFEGVLFAFKKYIKTQNSEYEVCVDFVSYLKNQELSEEFVSISQLTIDFMKVIKLDCNNIVYVNDNIQKNFSMWKKIEKSQTNTPPTE